MILYIEINECMSEDRHSARWFLRLNIGVTIRYYKRISTN
jgi:hypothetical protein